MAGDATNARATARPGRVFRGPSLRWLPQLLRLWRMYAALDLAFVAADIKLVLIYLLSDAVTNIAAVTGMLLLAERFAGIGDWSKPQVIFLLGYATTVSGLMSTFFGYNVLLISRRIGRGQLDHTLVQPQPLWLALLTEGFMPISGSAMLLPGLGLLLWGLTSAGVPVSPGWLALLALSLLASCAIVVAFSFAWGSLAFWAPRAAEEVSSSANTLMDQLKSFPLDGVGALLLGGLVSVVPVGFVAWYPCRVLLGIDHSPGAIWVTPLAALVFSTLTAFFFRKGMQHYVRTGSQRYSSLGHRG
jgi:ABC-2 type transport system permease protein